MRPNWFVALQVPPLDWFDRLVPPPPEGCRHFHRDDLHLTLAFLGAVDEDAARAGFAALRWPLGPQQVTLGRVVPMGSKHRFSALSALLSDARPSSPRCRRRAHRSGKPQAPSPTIAPPRRTSRWHARAELRPPPSATRLSARRRRSIWGTCRSASTAWPSAPGPRTGASASSAWSTCAAARDRAARSPEDR